MSKAAAAAEPEAVHAAEATPEALETLWERAEKQAEAAERVAGEQHAKALKALDGGAAEKPKADDTPRGKGGRFAKKAGEVEKPAAAPEKPAEKNPDEEPVTVAERVAWREERRQARAQLQRQEAEFHGLVARTRGDLEKRYAPLIAAQEALARDDIDGFAKAIGKGSWKDLVKERQQKIMSPEAQRIAELEQRERDREEKTARERQEAEQRAAQEHEHRVIGQYKSELSETMTKSEDQLVRALAKHPEFCDAVYQVQREHWDGETPIPPEEAVRMKRGDAPAIVDMLRASYQALHEAFGPPAAAKQEAPTGAADRSGSSPRGKQKPLSRNGAAEASPKASWKNDQEFISTWAKRLDESEPDDDDDD
jgi:hypothetical protein